MLEQPCPTCGHELDINNDICPACGMPRRRIRAERRGAPALWLVLLVSTALCMTAGWVAGLAFAVQSALPAAGGDAENSAVVMLLAGAALGIAGGLLIHRRLWKRGG